MTGRAEKPRNIDASILSHNNDTPPDVGNNIQPFILFLATYIFFLEGRLEIMKDYLTYYQQLDNSASSNYARYSKNWWIRRYEAHQYYRYLKKKLNKSYFITIDYIITRMINLFIK